MLDISSELLILPWFNGVKLLKPGSTQNHFNSRTLLSLGELLKFNFNVYLLDSQSSHKALNESAANIMGFDSIKSSLGKSIFDISKYHSANLIRDNDLSILKTGQTKIIEENLERTDEAQFQTLSYKFPLYQEDNHISGIFGCSIILGKHALADSLNQINRLGINHLTHSQLYDSKRYYLDPPNSDIYLTKKQFLYVKEYLRGKSSKQIANKFFVSPRTVEKQLELVKQKLGCNTEKTLFDAIQNSALFYPIFFRNN